MGFLLADNFMQNVRLFRTLWIRSRTGSGKTALAFRVAHELQRTGSIRYIISNCRSPWCDEIQSVELREGQFADVALIMDEAGLFMYDLNRSRKYLSFMRKMNIVLIMPTVQAPSLLCQGFQVKRLMNLGVIGAPLWIFRSRIRDSEEVMYETFGWYDPDEIFGTYDTEGFPSDDAGVEDALLRWSKLAARNTGYELKNLPGHSTFVVNEPSPVGEIAGGNQLELMEALRGASDSLQAAEAAQSDTLSVFQNAWGKKGRR